MPSIFYLLEYLVYFRSGDTNEPLHVHIGVKRPSDKDPKVWVNGDGRIKLDTNRKCTIPTNKLNIVLMAIKDNYNKILQVYESLGIGDLSFHSKFETDEDWK